jgi:protein tyrosine phosphatase
MNFKRFRNHLKMQERQIENTYINASYISSAYNKRAFVAMQSPLSGLNTVQFWTMMWQKKISNIVMLCPCQTADREESTAYWYECQNVDGRNS